MSRGSAAASGGLVSGCALGVAAGLFLFKTLDAILLARSLGAFIILYAGYSLWMTTRPPGSPPRCPRPAR